MFTPTNKLADLLPYFKRELEQSYSEREIDNIFYWIIAEKYQLNRIDLKITDKRLSESELLNFRAIVKRLEKKEPLQYILGTTEFYNCTIKVNQHVLIPRPETEELVDVVLKNCSDNAVILDIGTGSGCIPIALKKANNTFTVFGLDISAKAIHLAKQSAALNQTEIEFVEKDILETDLADLPLFNCIISNPPYVLESDKTKMADNVLEFEPHLALFVEDNDPLLFYRKIATLAQNKLHPKGKLFFEIHENFGKETVELLQDLKYHTIQILKDLQGKDRMISCEK